MQDMDISLHPYLNSCSFSSEFVDKIDNLNIPYTETDDGDTIVVKGTNMIDFVGKVDGNLTRLFPSLPTLKVWRCSKDAIMPVKARESDVGYDLTLVRMHKHLRNNVYMFGTGIKLGIPLGYYVEVVPRSSLSKTGWVLANSVGIIDASYTGEIFVVMARIDPTAFTYPPLPFKGFQLVLKKQEYALIVEATDEIDETARGEGGFGST